MRYILCFMIAPGWDDNSIMTFEFLLSPAPPVDYNVRFHRRVRFHCDSLKFIVMGVKLKLVADEAYRYHALSNGSGDFVEPAKID